MEQILETLSVSASEPFYRLVVVIALIVIASLLYQLRKEIKKGAELPKDEIDGLPKDE